MLEGRYTIRIVEKLDDGTSKVLSEFEGDGSISREKVIFHEEPGKDPLKYSVLQANFKTTPTKQRLVVVVRPAKASLGRRFADYIFNLSEDAQLNILIFGAILIGFVIYTIAFAYDRIIGHMVNWSGFAVGVSIYIWSAVVGIKRGYDSILFMILSMFLAVLVGISIYVGWYFLLRADGVLLFSGEPTDIGRAVLDKTRYLPALWVSYGSMVLVLIRAAGWAVTADLIEKLPSEEKEEED